MIRRAFWAALVAVLLSMAPSGRVLPRPVYAASTAVSTNMLTPRDADDQTTALTQYAGGSSVVEHPLYASTVNLATSYIIFLPPGYAESSQHYPVLYMLHGVAGDATEWQSIGLLEAADRMIQDGEIQPMLIVLPNGGAKYWVNNADGERWGDYVPSDIVTSVDQEYRTIPDPESRAIGGLSMGGEGALRLALLNPDVFGIAAAHSPSLRVSYDQLAPELQDLYGTEAQWRAGSPYWLVSDTDAAYRIKIALDVGEDDPWRANIEQLDERLTERGISHRFEVLPGEHAAEYWIGNVDHYLSFYSEAFQGNPVAQGG